MSENNANFENLKVWKRACNLSVELFKALDECQYFGLKDQVLRSSVSIPSNIAEGSERGSDADFLRFLYYAKGSCGELRTQLYISFKIGSIKSANCSIFINETKEISSMIQGLITKIKKDLANN